LRQIQRSKASSLDDVPEDAFYSSIAAAIRWLKHQPREELIDDDSVGWWLLMDFGILPTGKTLLMLSQKLSSLVDGKPLTNGNLYTFTAISRSLHRAGYPLVSFPNLRKTWDEAFQRKTRTKQFDIDYIWLLQMMVELWPEEARTKGEYIRPLLGSADPKRLVPTMAALLLKQLGQDVSLEVGSQICQKWWKIIDSDAFDESADWHISYAILVLLAFGEVKKAISFGTRLCAHQKQGGWDESSVECVESTSLCGLAMLELSVRAKMTRDASADRNQAFRDVSLLIDEHSWLFHAWKMIKNLPKGQEKGWALEGFVQQWMSIDAHLGRIQSNVRGGTDEVDLVIEMRKDSPLADLLPASQFLLIECKNTSAPIGAAKIRIFRDQLASRRPSNVKLGVYISTSGFTSDAKVLASGDLGKEQVIILFDGKEIESGLRKRLEFSEIVADKLGRDIIRRP